MQTIKSNLEEYSVLRIIGEGSWGSVRLVQHISTKNLFVFKIMSKSELVLQN